MITVKPIKPFRHVVAGQAVIVTDAYGLFVGDRLLVTDNDRDALLDVVSSVSEPPARVAPTT